VFRTVAVVLLLLLWVLGLVTGHTMGGFVHVLLVLALVLIRLVGGKNLKESVGFRGGLGSAVFAEP
jgi:hypothetical protein